MKLSLELILDLIMAGFQLDNDIMIDLEVYRANIECVSIDLLEVWDLSPAGNASVIEAIHHSCLIDSLGVPGAEFSIDISGDLHAFGIGFFYVTDGINDVGKETRGFHF